MAINFMFMANDVDPENQVKFPYYIDGDIEHSKQVVLFVGNSITYHEIKPDIGWHKQNGMAASDLDHDYVHLVLKALREKEPSTAAIVLNGGNWEVDFVNESKKDTIVKVVKQYKPTISVFRLGENSSKPIREGLADPTNYYKTLIKEVADNSGHTIVTSLFWEYPLLDNILKSGAEESNADFVFIGDLGYEDENKAIGLYEHPGIQGHPGDLGMERIAERILKVI